MAPDGVDPAGPAFLGERLAGDVVFPARDDPGGAEVAQIGLFLGSAGERVGLEAPLGQQHEGDAADAARGARDEDRAGGGCEAQFLESQEAEHRRVAGRADRHRLLGREGFGQADEPAARHPGHRRVAAVARLAQAPAVEDDGVAGLEPVMRARPHRTGEVDAGNERERADDRRLAGKGERVLVVQGGMADLDGDVAFGQVTLLDPARPRRRPAVGAAIDDERPDHPWPPFSQNAKGPARSAPDPSLVRRVESSVSARGRASTPRARRPSAWRRRPSRRSSRSRHAPCAPRAAPSPRPAGRRRRASS